MRLREQIWPGPGVATLQSNAAEQVAVLAGPGGGAGGGEKHSTCTTQAVPLPPAQLALT